MIPRKVHFCGEMFAREDLWRICVAVLDTDDLADQATYQRLLGVFRAEAEAGHRRRLLYGDDHSERPTEKDPRGD